MKSIKLLLIASLVVHMSHAQVGIGTTDPQAMLDVNGKVVMREFSAIESGTAQTLKFQQVGANANLVQGLNTEIIDFDVLGTVLRKYETTDITITQAQNTEILASDYTFESNPWVTHGESAQNFVLESDAQTIEFLFFHKIKNCRDLGLCNASTSYAGVHANDGVMVTPSQYSVFDKTYLRSRYWLRVSIIRTDVSPNTVLFSNVYDNVDAGKNNPNATLSTYPDGFGQYTAILTNVPAGTYKVTVEGRKGPVYQAGNPYNLPLTGIQFLYSSTISNYKPTDAEWQNIFVFELAEAKADFIIFENYID